MWPKSAIWLADLDHMTPNLHSPWPLTWQQWLCIFFQKKMWPLTFHQVWSMYYSIMLDACITQSDIRSTLSSPLPREQDGCTAVKSLPSPNGKAFAQIYVYFKKQMVLPPVIIAILSLVHYYIICYHCDSHYRRNLPRQWKYEYYMNLFGIK